MNGTQYEEFCRLFVRNELNIPIENIKSGYIPSAIRPGLEEYKNQIDLYWKLEDKLTRNLVIVNAKWRSSDKDKVEQRDVLLIQQVSNEIDANKAILITNTDFTDGARKAAKNHRIALHIVRPNFDYAILHKENRGTMQTQLQEFFNSSRPVYSHVEVKKTLDSGSVDTAQTTVPDKTGTHTKEMKQAPANRKAEPPSHRRASTGSQKVQSRQGTPQTGRQGGPPSGRQGGSGPPKGPAKGGGGTSNRSR